MHTPETPAERERANVEKKLKELEITHPVLLDPDGINWKRWGQQWWPTVYLVDRRGFVRYRWEGELEYQGADGTAKMSRRIEELLREPEPR